MTQYSPSGRAVAVDPVEVPGRMQPAPVDHPDLDGAAGAVAQLTKSLLPAGAEVSVVVLRGAEGQTVAATGGVARVLDSWQYRTGHGPSLQAAASAATVYAADLRTETRWPRWVRHGVDVGASSVLSLGLSIDDMLTGALTVYTTRPDAFSGDTLGPLPRLAEYAATALKAVRRSDAQAADLRNLQTAMGNRAVIEQAKGIIMGERRCTADEAFAILVKVSQNSNRKLYDVAGALVQRAVITPRPTGAPAVAPAVAPVRGTGPVRTARHPDGSAPAPGAPPDPPATATVAPVRVTTDVDGDGVVIIEVAGELVVDTAGELLAAIVSALSTDLVTRVVVDLARVSVLDMAALGALVRGRAVTLRAGASFRAVRPQRHVRQALHLTDMCELLATAPPAAENDAVPAVSVAANPARLARSA